MLLGRASGLRAENGSARVYGRRGPPTWAMFAMTLPDLLTSLLIGGGLGGPGPGVPPPGKPRRRAGGARFLGQSFTMITGLGAILAVVLSGLALSGWS